MKLFYNQDIPAGIRDKIENLYKRVNHNFLNFTIMKIKFFKLILPMAVVAFGIAGAMHTNAMSKKATTLVNKWGYTHIEGENCVLTNQMCRTQPGLPCKLGGEQLYDFVSTTSCPTPLNKIP